MPDDYAPATRGRAAAIQAVVLLALALLLFRREVRMVAAAAVHNREAAHALAAPLLIGLLLWRRWASIRRELTAGSPWGLALIALALLAVVAARYFNFAYPSWLAIVPAVAGVVLVVAGWRVLRLCVPALLIVALSIPIPPRLYAGFIVRLETVTLRAVATALDLLPGTIVELHGLDITYYRQSATGVIAAGEPARGASLLLAMLTIGVFVAFIRPRPWWHVALLGVAAIPIALVGNALRLAIWGLVTIATNAAPPDAAPRVIGVVLSLLAVWGCFGLTAAIASRIVTGGGAAPPRPDPAPEST